MYLQLHYAHLTKGLAEEELFMLSINMSATDNEPARCYYYFPTKAQQITDRFQM